MTDDRLNEEKADLLNVISVFFTELTKLVQLGRAAIEAELARQQKPRPGH